MSGITIKTTLGETQVDAVVCGAWAVHEHWDGTIRRRRVWAITHVATGLCVPPFYTENLSKPTAIRVAKALSKEFPNSSPGDSETGKAMAELIWKVSLGREA